MTPKQRLENLLSGKPVDRPPFFPAIYDYKSTLAKTAPHLFGQNERELFFALRQEAEALHAEILTSAYDIYNVEAEALGGKVTRDPTLLLPEMREPLITSLDQVEKLAALQKPAGRMRLFIAAAKEAVKKYGAEIPVRGGLSGPFSMAAKVFPREELLMATVTDPEGVVRLLRACTDAIEIYLDGFLEAGAGTALFDSFIVPPMLSPGLYEALVLPFHREIFSLLEKRGVTHRTLIAGGNTLPLLPHLVKCGANQLILDYNIPAEKIKETLITRPGTFFRVNLSPALIAGSTPEQVRSSVMDLLGPLKDCRNLILGTGILPPQTPAENLLSARRALLDFFSVSE
jgi:uroporphyrinogen decarboxylase